MKISKLLLLGAVAGMFATACQPNKVDNKQNQPTIAGEEAHTFPEPVCGTPITYDLIDETGSKVDPNTGLNYGFVQVLNSPTDVWCFITLETANGRFVDAASTWFAASATAVTDPVTGNLLVDQMNQFTINPNVSLWKWSVASAGTSACNEIATRIGTIMLDDFGDVLPGSELGLWVMGENEYPNGRTLTYCTQSCNATPCVIEPGAFRTQTQGGWGSNASGNNPGAYRDANFAAAFPAGVTIGCNTRTATWNSSAAVNNFLPCSAAAKQLPVGAAVNPGCSGNYRSVIFGQALALSLSVGFDNAIATYSTSGFNLSGLVVTSGPMAGLTVGQVLTEANNAIGGCGSAYSLSAINSTLDGINNNFVDGTAMGTYLACPN